MTNSFHFQKKTVHGHKGILMLKSVKRTDAGVYSCTALDFDNLEADLSGTINLTIHCEWAKDMHTDTQ